MRPIPSDRPHRDPQDGTPVADDEDFAGAVDHNGELEEDGISALLPAGLRDILPVSAQTEAEIVDALIASFASHGYERVKPPLLEFEETLLSGPGAACAKDTFRLMDPISQRMMGVRADITPQIGRIATTRLRTAQRPLRLSYAGQVLRVRGGQLRPNRQFGQVGVEIIGSDSAWADVEVVLLAADGLQSSGIQGLTIDLNLPPLAPALARALGLSQRQTTALLSALDHKDVAAVKSAIPEHAELFVSLLQTVGLLDTALEKLEAVSLPSAVHSLISAFCTIARRVREAAPDLALTIDPLERRGFEYQTGVCFTVFARGVRAELGRGGRYLAGTVNGHAGEHATGFTLFADTIVQAASQRERSPRVLVPQNLPRAAGDELRSGGWVTVMALDGTEATDEEATRVSCSHILRDGHPKEV